MDGFHIALTILLLLGLFERMQAYRERRDLYNRLMSRDLTEYRGTTPGQTRNFLKRALEKSRTVAEKEEN